MADLRPQFSEEAVGANHPTKTDVINRAYNVEHKEDGTHKAITPPSISGMTTPLSIGQGGSGTTGDSIIKGWIRFDGTGVIAIQDSYNVSGIVDNGGAGDYTVTWDTDFSNIDYACVASSNVYHTDVSTYAVGSIDIATYDANHDPFDVAQICVIGIGDQ